jgi:hypothetical protein
VGPEYYTHIYIYKQLQCLAPTLAVSVITSWAAAVRYVASTATATATSRPQRRRAQRYKQAQAFRCLVLVDQEKVVWCSSTRHSWAFGRASEQVVTVEPAKGSRCRLSHSSATRCAWRQRHSLADSQQIFAHDAAWNLRPTTMRRVQGAQRLQGPRWLQTSQLALKGPVLRCLH